MVTEAGAGSGVPDAAGDKSREAESEVEVDPERIDKVGGGVNFTWHSDATGQEA